MIEEIHIWPISGTSQCALAAYRENYYFYLEPCYVYFFELSVL